MSAFRLLAGALLASAGATACSNSKDTTPAPTRSFVLSVSPTSVSVQAGGASLSEQAAVGKNASGQDVSAGTATFTVTIARSGGFEGPITVSVENLPTGVTASALAVAAGATAGTVTLTAALTATVGGASLIVRGTGTNVESRTAPLNLDVTAPPSFAMTLSPATVVIQQAQTGTSTLNITRAGGFAGVVNIVAIGAPAGLTIAPSSVSGASAVLTITVVSSVPIRLYTITIQGSGANVLNKSATLLVGVTAPPGFITLALSQAAVSTEQGQSGTSNLTINRTNFAGTVNLTSRGAPSGMGVSFNPGSTTGNTSVVTVAVAGSVGLGPQQVTIQAAGTDISSVTIVLTVTVTATASRIAYALGDQAAIGGADPALQFNGLGGPITVTRQAVGDYTVTIPGFGGTASESRLPFVNALNSNDVACAPVSWTMIGAVVFDATVRVMCVNGFSGAAVDSRFLFFATGQQGLSGRFAFGGSGPVSSFPVPNATIALPSASSWTSGTPPVRLKRDAFPTGIFAWLPGLPASPALTMRMIPIIHTASVAGPRCFGGVELFASSPEVDIAVQCYAVPGGPAASVDAPFNVLMVEAGRSGRRFGAVVNNQPTNPLYVPSPNFARSSSGGAISITRNVAGVYKVRFPGLGRLADGREVVIMHGLQSGLQPQQRCVLEQITSTGADLEADVRCYRDNGVLFDATFILLVIE